MSTATNLLTRQRKQLLDASWIASMLVILAAVLVPWYLRALEIDVKPIVWLIAAYLVLYLAAAALADRLPDARGVTTAMSLLQGMSVVFLAIVWHLAGGVHNPLFLLAFVLPVIAAGMVALEWHRYVIALLSVVCVFAVALMESEGLRWYLGDIGIVFPPLPLLTTADPFPGDEISPVATAVMLETFAVFQLAAALLAGSVASVLERLVARVHSSSASLREIQDLFQAILRAAPHPGAIVYRDNAQLVHVSDSFLKRLLLSRDEIAGRTLYELVQFSQPERIAQLLKKGGGTAFYSVYRVGGEQRVANVATYVVQHENASYAYVAIEDVTRQYYLAGAFDAVATPLLLIGADGKLLYANRVAEEVFGALYFGMDVDSVLSVQGMSDGWWRTPTRFQTEPRVRFGGQPYQASSVPFRLAGETESSIILTLRGIAHEEELLALATHDALTGLYNLRFLNSILPEELAATTDMRRCAYAAVDLDYFKPINDQLGHAAGDAALIAFAGHVRAELRPSDIFARVGGDEFAIVFPDSDTATAHETVQRVYARLAQNPFLYEESSRTLSFSSGLVRVRPGENIESLKERADRAVYEAKEKGRGNCVVGE